MKKIKIYKGDDGNLKGDALISFENIESVDVAIEMLHESNIRPDCIIKVQPAEFEMKGEEYRERKIQKLDVVDKKRIQAEKERRFAWTEEQANKGGLKIVILKHMFSPEDIKQNENLVNEIEIDVKDEVESSCGGVQKIEIFKDHPDGVIKIKFFTPLSAERCVGTTPSIFSHHLSSIYF